MKINRIFSSYRKKEKEKSFGKKMVMSRCVIVLIENDVIIVEVGENEFIIYSTK